MNFEPFTPFERSEPLVQAPVAKAPSPAPSTEPTHCAHYFDRAGCVWIVACVLLAGASGRLLPTLAEPGGLRHALVALGLGSQPAGSAKTSTTVASLPLQNAKPAEATREVQVKQEVGPRVSAILRQF